MKIVIVICACLWYKKSSCGCSLMVELLPSKQVTAVRFRSPAPSRIFRSRVRELENAIGTFSIRSWRENIRVKYEWRSRPV